jgi:phospholipid/cholesterol/gamma-HCH transport system permease protein
VSARAASALRPLGALGRAVLSSLAVLGRGARFCAAAMAAVVRPPLYPREIGRAALTIGFLSLPVVGLSAVFTGAALALQIHEGSARFGAETAVPTIVAIAMVREIGPVLTGLMVAARVASAIAAELGTMKVTEQVDALLTLSTDPMRYLVAPRVLAATLSLPLLVAVADILGIMGGWAVGAARLGIAPGAYLETTAEFLRAGDIVSGLVKGAVFGLIVALMGCRFGLAATGGARGVGRATTGAVVASAVLILGANYLLTEAFFSR